MAENSEINSSISYSANSSRVLLQATKFNLLNLVNKREIKVKTFDFCWDLVTEKVKTGKPGNPASVETVFGWILNESVANKSVDSSTNFNISENHVLYFDSAVRQSFDDIGKK